MIGMVLKGKACPFKPEVNPQDILDVRHTRDSGIYDKDGNIDKAQLEMLERYADKDGTLSLDNVEEFLKMTGKYITGSSPVGIWVSDFEWKKGLYKFFGDKSKGGSPEMHFSKVAQFLRDTEKFMEEEEKNFKAKGQPSTTPRKP